MSKPIVQPKEYQGWKVGQQCQVKELNGIWVIDYINIFDFNGPNCFAQAHVTKLKRDGSRSKYNSSVRLEDLLPIGAAQPNTDRNGLTAAQYAQEVFKHGFAVHDYYNTTRQSLMKVLSISKTGRVKAQFLNIKKGIKAQAEVINGKKIPSQELSVINWMNLEYTLYSEPRTFTPRLHNSEWGFWHEGGYIKAPGMKLEWLLD